MRRNIDNCIVHIV